MNLSLTSLFFVGAALSAPAQDQVIEAQSQEQGSLLGEPLVVNGTEIPVLEIKRFLIYGPGRRMLEWRKIETVMELELERLEREDPEFDMSNYEVSDADFNGAYDQVIEKFMVDYPVLDVETEIARANRATDWYRASLGQTLRFDRVFLPSDPVEWPPLTQEAVLAGGGEILMKDAMESYERRLKYATENSVPLPEEDSMYMSLLRQMVLEQLYGVMNVQTAADGLPPNLVLRIDDGARSEEITTDEMWGRIEDTITKQEVRIAKRFLSTIAATRDRLVAEGKLLTDEELQAAYNSMRAQFAGQSAFNFDMVALEAHQFPSVESYREHFLLSECFRRSIAPELELTEEGALSQRLQDHLPRANAVMGLGKVDVQALLLGAYHPRTHTWLEDGWGSALKRAQGVKASYDAAVSAWELERQRRLQAQAAGEEFVPTEGLVDPEQFWSQLVEAHCDYWDPPPPETSRGSAVGYKMAGRWGAKTRNDLQRMMDESPFLRFVTGNSLTDQAFFKQDPGTVEGPFIGPMGYYVLRVVSKTPPNRPLDISNEKHVELLRDDCVRENFLQYAREAADAAEISGIDPEV